MENLIIKITIENADSIKVIDVAAIQETVKREVLSGRAGLKKLRCDISELILSFEKETGSTVHWIGLSNPEAVNVQDVRTEAPDIDIRFI